MSHKCRFYIIMAHLILAISVAARCPAADGQWRESSRAPASGKSAKTFPFSTAKNTVPIRIPNIQTLWVCPHSEPIKSHGAGGRRNRCFWLRLFALNKSCKACGRKCDRAVNRDTENEAQLPVGWSPTPKTLLLGRFPSGQARLGRLMKQQVDE
jgi:hypothetical protein